MRIIIVGAGAIGGSLAAELSRINAELIVVARGSHGDRIATAGLHYRTPELDCHIAMDVAPSVEDLQMTPDDLVILTTKIGDVEDAARSLAALDKSVPVVCFQNGVAGEAITAKHMERVYAGMVYMPATYLEAGSVDNYCSNGPGALRIGPYQGGRHPLCEELAERFSVAGFNAASVEEIMPWKYGKLLTNLGNALEVSCSDWKNAGALYERTLAEGEACLQAADIPYLPVPELVSSVSVEIDAIGGKQRPGGSMWQSVARKREPEVRYLNGAIVALGAAHGISTPINQMLVEAAWQTAEDGTRWTAIELAARV
jgi:2-dehydropantoate 2-reductase